MKKKIFALTAAVFLALFLIPFPVFAAGYVASRNSDVFHEPSCFYVDRIKQSNLIYFDTIEEAQNSGRHGCSRCNPTAGNYTSNSSTTPSSSSSTSAAASYFDGYADGKAKGYDNGYTAGLSDGKEDGYNRGYAAGQSDMKEEMDIQIEAKQKSAAKTAYLISFFFGVPVVAFLSSAFVGRSRDKTEKELKSRISLLNQELQKEKNNAVFRAIHPDAETIPLIPDGITLKPSCIPVKGSPNRFRPYGDYTVYTTNGGKKYHCKYRCCNATKPMHYFQLPSSLEPCKNCVSKDMYPQKLPDWYLKVTGVLPEGIEKPGPSSPPRASVSASKSADTASTNPNASSYIADMEYKDGSLFLTFTSGGTYSYYNVPESIFKEMLAAPSKDKFYHERIKDQYPYTRKH